MRWLDEGRKGRVLLLGGCVCNWHPAEFRLCKQEAVIIKRLEDNGIQPYIVSMAEGMVVVHDRFRYECQAELAEMARIIMMSKNPGRWIVA